MHRGGGLMGGGQQWWGGGGGCKGPLWQGSSEKWGGLPLSLCLIHDNKTYAIVGLMHKFRNFKCV